MAEQSSTSNTPSSRSRKQDFHHPQGYVVDPLQPSYGSFVKRKICPAIYVDLHHIKEEIKVDLIAFLKQYEPLIGSRLPYSPSVVRSFYCKLKTADVGDDEGGAVEKRLQSTVRGKQFQLSAEFINQSLGIGHPPSDGFVNRSPADALAVLKPQGDQKGLPLTPGSMSAELRILWYIYTRCIVSKGNNFTKFSTRDYVLFASVVAKDTRNLGVMVMKELNHWLETDSGSRSLPFPHLVSLFLNVNQIWYLETSEEIVTVPRFGKSQLRRMCLTVETGDGEGQMKVMRKRSTPHAMDDVHCSSVARPEPTPSIEVIVQKAVQQALHAQPSAEQIVKKAVDEAVPIERIVNKAVDRALDLVLQSHMQVMAKTTIDVDDIVKRVGAGIAELKRATTILEHTTDEIWAMLKGFEEVLFQPRSPPQASRPSVPPHAKAGTSSSPATGEQKEHGKSEAM